MKQNLTLVALLASFSFGFCQGQVNFANTSSTRAMAGGYFWNETSQDYQFLSGPTAPTPGLFYFGIFWAPSTMMDPNQFSLFGYGTNQSVAGRFSGGVGTANAPAIPGMPIGSTVNVLFRGWSSNLGHDWDTISPMFDSIVGGTAISLPPEGGFYGQSGIGTVVLGGGVQPIPTPFGIQPGQISSGLMMNSIYLEADPALLIYIVPEPSVLQILALAILGATALVAQHRRRQ